MESKYSLKMHNSKNTTFFVTIFHVHSVGGPLLSTLLGSHQERLPRTRMRGKYTIYLPDNLIEQFALGIFQCQKTGLGMCSKLRCYLAIFWQFVD